MSDFDLILRNGSPVALPRAATIILADIKAYDAYGGTFTSGAWRHRDLGTVVAGGSHVTLSGNRFTPAAGNWLVQWSAPACGVSNHVSRLYNYTATTAVTNGTGSVELCSSATQVSHSQGAVIITANGTDAYQIEHKGAVTLSTYGFGNRTNMSDAPSVYTIVTLQQVT
jgi:hypothetical protein